jgi:hypothetical protein
MQIFAGTLSQRWLFCRSLPRAALDQRRGGLRRGQEVRARWRAQIMPWLYRGRGEEFSFSRGLGELTFFTLRHVLFPPAAE